MRPVLFAILLGPLFRIRAPVSNASLQSLAHARKIPILDYPLCPRPVVLSRRDFSCFSCLLQAQQSSQSPIATMADLSPESQEEVARLAEPCESEADILKGSEARESAVEGKQKEVNESADVESSKGLQKEEEKLPKLSAADFKIYNHMAEHMDYFVCLSPLVSFHFPNPPPLSLLQ